MPTIFCTHESEQSCFLPELTLSLLMDALPDLQLLKSRGSQNHAMVKFQDVLKPFIFLFVANLAVLISEIVVSPLKYQLIAKGSIDEFGRPNHFYTTCAAESRGWADVLFLVLWYMINISALLLANFQAYKGRCILTEYSESEYIGISMAILLQAFIIGLPVFYVSSKVPNAIYVVECCLIFVTVLAVLIPTFVPKIHFLRQCELHEKQIRKKLLLKMKKQRQMDALGVGDGSLTSWCVQQMEGSPSNNASSTDQQLMEFRIVARPDSTENHKSLQGFSSPIIVQSE